MGNLTSMYNRLAHTVDFYIYFTLQTEVAILYTVNSMKDTDKRDDTGLD